MAPEDRAVAVAGESAANRRLPRGSVLVCGLLAGATALSVLLVGRFLTSRPGFLEAVADGFIRYVPLETFELGLQTFGPLAKGLLFAGVSSGVLAAGAAVALLVERRHAVRAPLLESTLISLAVLAVSEAIVLPLAGAGPFGLGLRGDLLALQVPLVAAAFSYGVTLVGLLAGWAPARTRREQMRAGSAVVPGLQRERGTASDAGGLPRRRFIGRTLAFVGLGALAGSGMSIVRELLAAASSVRQATLSTTEGGDASAPSGEAAPQPTPADPFGPTPAVTPVDEFYQVNKNLLPTVVDGSTWRLRVDGLVERPLELSLDDLRAMPAETGYRTLECISYQIVAGDDLIGNQKWRGVRVSEIVGRARPTPAASWILWESDDGYTESIPLDVALEDETWIAYEMGDAPLTAEHGFPARVLIAGRFGMKQPKWLRRIQLADHDEPGYWEQRGWDDQAVVQTMSRIDFPAAGYPVPAGEPFVATGIANAGDRGVAAVQLSADDGATWLNAELEDATRDPLGPLTWVRWRVAVAIPQEGRARLVVRAIDGDGALQEERETSPLPSGSTGWHAVRVVATQGASGVPDPRLLRALRSGRPAVANGPQAGRRSGQLLA